MSFSILSVEDLSSEQRLALAEKLKTWYQLAKDSVFVGLGEDEYKAIVGEDTSSRSFYLLFAKNKLSDQLIHTGVIELVWESDAIEMDALYIDPRYRSGGQGTLLILAAIYLAAVRVKAEREIPHYLEISVLDTIASKLGTPSVISRKTSKLIKLYESFGASLEGKAVYRQDGINYPIYRLRINHLSVANNPSLFEKLERYISPFFVSSRTIDVEKHAELRTQLRISLLKSSSSCHFRMGLNKPLYTLDTASSRAKQREKYQSIDPIRPKPSWK